MKTSNKILVGSYLTSIIIAIGFIGFLKSNMVEYTPIESEGKLETITYNLPSLKTIDASVGEVTLINGEPKVEIICGENIKKMIDSGFEDGKFYIHKNGNYTNELAFEINVYSDDLESITLSNRATLKSQGKYSAKELQINMHNFSKTYLSLAIDADVLKISSSNSSSFFIGEGNIDLLEVESSNSAIVHTHKIKPIEAIVQSSNSSFVSVGSIEKLNLNASNSSHIKYYDDPKVVNKNISNSARISRYKN